MGELFGNGRDPLQVGVWDDLVAGRWVPFLGKTSSSIISTVKLENGSVTGSQQKYGQNVCRD